MSIPTSNLAAHAPKLNGVIGATVNAWGDFTATSGLVATVSKSLHSERIGVTSSSVWSDSNTNSKFTIGTISVASPITYVVNFDYVANNTNAIALRINNGIHGLGQSSGAMLYITRDGWVHAAPCGNPEKAPADQLTDGEHSIVVVFDSILKIYVDGTLVLAESAGSYSNYQIYMLPSEGCVLFETMVYTRAITPVEVTQIYTDAFPPVVEKIPSFLLDGSVIGMITPSNQQTGFIAGEHFVGLLSEEGYVEGGIELGVAVTDSTESFKFQALTTHDGNTVQLSGVPKQITTLNGFVTGMPEPVFYATATVYYRCSSVDTVNKTWSGYRSNFINGKYVFDITETTGLTYTFITPSVGVIYDSNVMVVVDSLWGEMPKNGLVFYAPLNTATTEAVTGQTLTIGNGIVHGVVEGIPCATFSTATQSITFPAGTTVPYGSQSRSFSFWANTSDGENGAMFLSYGSGSSHSDIAIYGGYNYGFTANVNAGMIRFGTGGATVGTWHHFLLNLENDSAGCSFYMDNVNLTQSVTNSWYLSTSSNTTFNIGCATTLSSMFAGGLLGSIAALRIYNRTMSTDEIVTLYSEFTPTA